MFNELAVDVFLNGLSGLFKIDFNKGFGNGRVWFAADKLQAYHYEKEEG